MNPNYEGLESETKKSWNLIEEYFRDISDDKVWEVLEAVLPEMHPPQNKTKQKPFEEIQAWSKEILNQRVAGRMEGKG